MIINLLVETMSITYDDKGHISSVSYSTTLSTDIPVEEALQIISFEVVARYLSHTERVNGANKPYGRLSSITEDKGQERYCFSISGAPKTLQETFELEIEI